LHMGEFQDALSRVQHVSFETGIKSATSTKIHNPISSIIEYLSDSNLREHQTQNHELHGQRHQRRQRPLEYTISKYSCKLISLSFVCYKLFGDNCGKQLNDVISKHALLKDQALFFEYSQGTRIWRTMLSEHSLAQRPRRSISSSSSNTIQIQNESRQHSPIHHIVASALSDEVSFTVDVFRSTDLSHELPVVESGKSETDTLIFFKPPENCSLFPQHTKGHIQLRYFGSSKACILPSDSFNKSRGNTEGVRQPTRSLHTGSADEIRLQELQSVQRFAADRKIVQIWCIPGRSLINSFNKCRKQERCLNYTSTREKWKMPSRAPCVLAQ